MRLARRVDVARRKALPGLRATSSVAGFITSVRLKVCR
jgi:hypothetical protein